MIFAVFAVLIVLFVILPLVWFSVWWLVSTIIVGLIVGALGRLVVPGRNPIGFWPTVACGLIGSLIGGILGHALHHGRVVTLLIEVAVSAASVAIWSGSHRSIGGGRRMLSR